MKRVLISALSLAVLLWISGLTALATPSGRVTQGKAAAHKKEGASKAKKPGQKEEKAEEKGKPAEKGLQHAEQVASPQGVEHGIQKAEGKQATHAESKATTAKGDKGKHKAKGKEKPRAPAPADPHGQK